MTAGFGNLARRTLARILPSDLKYKLLEKRLALRSVRHHSAATNVYHCCVHKTGSQWVRAVLSDPRIYAGCGLKPHNYQSLLPARHDPRKVTERRFDQPFPEGTVVTPIYIDYANFTAIPKPASWRAFFVMRDPRDVLVSWYFSQKHSHPVQQGRIEENRRDLQQLEKEQGMLLAIDRLADTGLFEALRSWLGVEQHEPNVRLVRYCDLIGPRSHEVFAQLLAHCDIQVSDTDLAAVLGDLSFENLAGRRRGEEDVNSKYRKGVPGDWRNHFTPAIAQRFDQVTGDLCTAMGYEA